MAFNQSKLVNIYNKSQTVIKVLNNFKYIELSMYVSLLKKNSENLKLFYYIAAKHGL